MTVLSSILVPLDGSAHAAGTLGCAAWLAQRLGARLHILSATAQECPARQELVRLRVPEAYWPLIMLHQAPAFPEDAILAALRKHEVDLVVLAARGESSERGPANDPLDRLVGHVAQAVLEASPAPVLLMPRAYRERLPWDRVLVPISGEAEVDTALGLAVRLANALDLRIEVAHVVGAGTGGEPGLAALGEYADAAHHEFPGRLEALVRRALPEYGVPECRCIEDVTLHRGETGAALTRLIEEKPPSVLVLGWHGRFMTGHAPVVKRILQVSTSPVLLVKAEAPAPFRLKVGPDIQ